MLAAARQGGKAESLDPGATLARRSPPSTHLTKRSTSCGVLIALTATASRMMRRMPRRSGWSRSGSRRQLSIGLGASCVGSRKCKNGRGRCRLAGAAFGAQGQCAKRVQSEGCNPWGRLGKISAATTVNQRQMFARGQEAPSFKFQDRAQAAGLGPHPDEREVVLLIAQQDRLSLGVDARAAGAPRLRVVVVCSGCEALAPANGRVAGSSLLCPSVNSYRAESLALLVQVQGCGGATAQQSKPPTIWR